MRSTHTWLTLPIVLVMLALAARVYGQTPDAKPADNPYPYAADEPKAKAFSLSKSTEYLDGVAQFWMRPNSCGACHANFAYVMASPLLGEQQTPLLVETRRFLEKREPTPQFSFNAHAVAIAFALAWDDARSGDKLQPATRQALRRMWALQKPEGGWSKMGCGEIVPSENDRHYTAVLAALAVGLAPEGYARTPEAQDGLTRLRRYFAKSPPRNLHDEALLLWASLHVDGLMTTAEREATVQALLARQGPDGGWSFAALSDRAKHPAASGLPSDGYGTGFAIYVLRQAGVPATRPDLARGVRWLHSHQRASGRWFTPSEAANHPTEGGVGARDLYVQNLGTAFTVLALKACEGTDSRLSPENPRALRKASGLSLRDRLIFD